METCAAFDGNEQRHDRHNRRRDCVAEAQRNSAPRIESWPSELGLLFAFANRCVSRSLAWDSKWKSRSEWDERDALAEARLLSSEGRNHADRLSYGQTATFTRKEGSNPERMVGEALARLLTESDLQAANEILDKAEAFINARNSEVARRWQLSAAAVVCAIAILVGGVLWIGRSFGIAVLGAFAFTAVIGACAGGLGATTSLLLRIRQMSFDVSAGREAHRFDGAVRVLAGMAGAVVAAFAVRVNLVGGIVNGLPHPFAALMLVCVIDGASERLVPDLINRLEGTFRK